MTDAVVAEVDRSDDGLALRASVTCDGSRRQITFRVSAGPIASGADALLAATLLPAMWTGRRLRIQGRVSPMLLAGASEVQAVWNTWDGRFQRVAVEAESVAAAGPEPPPGSGVGCFFTAGVDSFHTLLACRSEITELVYVHGFEDTAVDDLRRRQMVTSALRRVADELGKPLVEVETNLRSIAEVDVHWPLYHGSALAAVALLLAPRYHRMIVPATHTYAYLFPSGSSPLLVPMWNTEGLTMVSHGAGATRIEKVVGLVREEPAMRSLRVCFENQDGEYNCGRCEKCVRTMVELRIAGGLDRCATLPGPLDLAEVARLAPANNSARHFLEENLAAARASGTDPDLVRALRRAVVVNARVARLRQWLRQRARRLRSVWRTRRFGP